VPIFIIPACASGSGCYAGDKFAGRGGGDFVLPDFCSAKSEMSNYRRSIGTIAAPDVNGGVISKGRARSLAEAATEREPLVERYPRRLASIRW
jgi:hypothetical protein